MASGTAISGFSFADVLGLIAPGTFFLVCLIPIPMCKYALTLHDMTELLKDSGVPFAIILAFLGYFTGFVFQRLITLTYVPLIDIATTRIRRTRHVDRAGETVFNVLCNRIVKTFSIESASNDAAGIVNLAGTLSVFSPMSVLLERKEARSRFYGNIIGVLFAVGIIYLANPIQDPAWISQTVVGWVFIAVTAVLVIGDFVVRSRPEGFSNENAHAFMALLLLEKGKIGSLTDHGDEK